MTDIEYLEPPILKEILEQHRLILEIHKEIVAHFAKAPLIYSGAEDLSIRSPDE